MKKNILITGTSTGVGFESAILFAQHGYKVYATMRDLSKSIKLDQRRKEEDLDIHILQLDVTDNQSIKNTVDSLIAEDQKLDILLNNAGAGFARTLEQTTPEQINWVTDVNYFGVIRTTQAVLPFMREAGSGHIINITSVGGLVGQPFNELYCGAKFAVEGFTEALASYVTPSFGINFSLIEPGGIATAFMNNAITKTVDSEGNMVSGAYAPIFQKYVSGAQNRAGSGEVSPYQSALEVAEVILDVAHRDNPPLRVRTSQWAEDLCHLKTNADPDGTKLRDKVTKYFL